MNPEPHENQFTQRTMNWMISFKAEKPPHVRLFNRLIDSGVPSSHAEKIVDRLLFPSNVPKTKGDTNESRT